MAVYTDVSAEDLGAFLANYDLGALLSYKGIAEGVENSNFLVHTGTGHYILTLYEKRVAAGDVPFFLALMEHLAARGITCPQPVKDRKDQTLGTLCGRPAAIVTFLDGMWMRRPDPNHCAAVGEALARMHLAGADFSGRRQNALSVGGWRALFEQAKDRADSVQRDLRSLIETELVHLEKAWPRDLPQGVIHADLFPDNVFFLGERLSGLIDFYFACTDTLAYDVAICLNAWCFEADHSYNVTKGRNLLAAYRRVRPFSVAERDALPLLARGAAMRFLLTRLVDWLNVPAGAMVRPKNPLEYVRKLRFHQKAESVRDYGLPTEGAAA
jgi:homoserine kinase type II